MRCLLEKRRGVQHVLGNPSRGVQSGGQNHWKPFSGLRDQSFLSVFPCPKTIKKCIYFSSSMRHRPRIRYGPWYQPHLRVVRTMDYVGGNGLMHLALQSPHDNPLRGYLAGHCFTRSVHPHDLGFSRSGSTSTSGSSVSVRLNASTWVSRINGPNCLTVVWFIPAGIAASRAYAEDVRI